METVHLPPPLQRRSPHRERLALTEDQVRSRNMNTVSPAAPNIRTYAHLYTYIMLCYTGTLYVYVMYVSAPSSGP